VAVSDRGAGRGLLTTAAAVALAVGVAAVVVLGGLYLRAPRATRVGVGDKAPDFVLPSVENARPQHSLALRGGPALVVFFDTRWPSTASYLPYLDRMYRRYYRRGLRMMAVSTDSDPAAPRDFAKRANLSFTVLSDPDSATLGKLYGIPRDPEAYLLDPEGRVEAVFLAPINWRDPATREKIERHLGRSQGW
jgi:peroxiredoxin